MNTVEEEEEEETMTMMAQGEFLATSTVRLYLTIETING